MNLADVIDGLIEAPVVTSFSRVGYAVRKRVDDWRPSWTYDMRDRTVVITGPTSGIGEAAANAFARLGATLVLVARNESKVSELAERLSRDFGNDRISTVLADLGDVDMVREAGRRIAGEHDRVDVLVHNAGSLFNDRRTQPDGTETTLAVHVVGPFLLTGVLLDSLEEGSRVITMSSGGMYTVPLTVGGIEMDPSSYKGATQYALAKRAQVTLNEMWAERVRRVRFHAMHPGWVDTPGVEDSLPGFHRLVGPVLRTPSQGADTMVWLAADPEPGTSSGRFWLDRRVRDIHKLARTRRSDTPERRGRLWEWVSARAGWDLR
ncbi:MAG: SDR family NAD(P)-dependent oxidoreductase [Acidimicrobiia bacterium]